MRAARIPHFARSSDGGFDATVFYYRILGEEPSPG